MTIVFVKKSVKGFNEVTVCLGNVHNHCMTVTVLAMKALCIMYTHRERPEPLYDSNCLGDEGIVYYVYIYTHRERPLLR